MINSTDTAYLRLRITGTLKVISALHLGTGDAERFQPKGKSGEEPVTVNTVARDREGKPYLTASSLRGALRARVRDQGLRNRLFGFAEKDKGQAGALRVYDARARSSPELNQPGNEGWPYRTGLRYGVAIDPITATVKEGMLFCDEIVLEGTVFGLCLEADNVMKNDIPKLLALLEAWDGGCLSGVGADRATLHGRLKWDRERLQVLDGAALADWLKQTNAGLDGYYQDLSVPPAALALDGLETLTIKIHPQAPFLINDPGYVLPKKSLEGAEDKKGNTPDLQYSRTADGKKAVIPGRSLRGLLRARARRILATLFAQQTDDCSVATNLAESLIKELFGRDQKRGTVWISDAVAEGGSAEHPQLFNAIDRFTGGVAQGKLYSVVAAECDTLTCTVAIDSQRALRGEWWKGLLLLVARDALEGEFTIGWGKTRGYGALRFSITVENQTIKTWTQFLNWLKSREQTDNVQACVDSLHEKINEVAAEISPREQHHAE